MTLENRALKLSSSLARRALACLVLLSFLCANATADFTDEFQSALKLYGEGKHAEARAQFAALAAKAPTPGAKSDSLRYAVLCELRMKQFREAEALLGGIPREGTKKLCWMNLLLDQRQPQELINRFQNEELTEWPDVHVFDALMARAQAYRRLQQPAAALNDFAKAEEFATTPAKQAHLLNATATTLQESGDDERALAAYRRMKGIPSLKGYGISNDAIVSAAKILAKQGRYDEALRELEGIPPAASGYWRCRPLMVRAEILAARGNKTEALADYGKALETAPNELRATIQAAMGKLQ